MSPRFRYRFRVRYGECDAQKIVFNARWGDYVDLATTEYLRALLGSVDPDVAGIDWRLVRQLIEWRAPALFDDVLEAEVETVRVGITSFVLATGFRRVRPTGDDTARVTAETTYVAIHPGTGQKHPLADDLRKRLLAGVETLVDHGG